MDWGVLGTLVVTRKGRPVHLGPPKQRAVVALLLIANRHPVPAERIIEELWGDAPPPAAMPSLRAYISNLRRVLEPDRLPRTPAGLLVSGPAGYALEVNPEELDSARFADLARVGSTALTAGHPQEALVTLDQALGLWRGSAYADFADEEFVRTEVAHLDGLRLAAEENRVAAELALGHADVAAGALERLVVESPLRERRWELLALARYRSSGQSQALAAIREARRVLADEVGLDPGPQLRRLEKAIHAGTLEPTAVGPRRIAAVPDVRETAPDLGVVGRELELSALRRACRDLGSGSGGLLLFTGEAGVGKTRLLRAAAEIATAAGRVVVTGDCHEDANAPALWPWTGVLRELVARYGRELVTHGHRRLLPLIGEEPDNPDHLDDAAEGDTARFRLHAELVDLFVEVARRAPLLITLDDLHWADVDSLRVLSMLTRRLPREPVLVVSGARDDEVGGPAPISDLLGAIAWDGVRRLPLHGLGAEPTERLLGVRLGAPVRADLARTVHERTGGNPFHLVELARLLADEPPDRMTELARVVPPSVTAVVRRRLIGLPRGAEPVLLTAAVAGREFDHRVLALVHAPTADQADPVDTDALHVPADALLDVLDAAVGHGIIRETEVVGRFRFGHEIVRETVLGSASKLRLAQRHALLARALERSITTDDPGPVEALARHWLAAAPLGHHDEAIAAARRAARNAERLMAHDSAAALLREALAVLDVSFAGDDPRRRYDLLLELGLACGRCADFTAAQEYLDAAIACARRLDDPEALARAATAFGGGGGWNWRDYLVVDGGVVEALQSSLRSLPAVDSALRCRVLANLGTELFYAAGSEGLELSDEAVAMARRLNDPDLLAAVLHLRFVTLWDADSLAERRLIATELVELAADPQVGPSLAPTAAFLSAVTGFEAGDRITADLEAARCESLLQRAPVPAVEVQLRWWRGMVAQLAGDWPVAERLAEEALEVHRATGLLGAENCYAAQLMMLRVEQGQPAQAEAVLWRGGEPKLLAEQAAFVLAEQGRREAARGYLPPARDAVPVPRGWLRLFLEVVRAQVWTTLGDAESARHALAVLTPYSGRVAVTGTGILCWGSVDHFIGELHALLGHDADAARYLTLAVDRNEELGAIVWADRSRARLAEVTRRRAG